MCFWNHPCTNEKCVLFFFFDLSDILCVMNTFSINKIKINDDPDILTPSMEHAKCFTFSVEILKSI